MATILVVDDVAFERQRHRMYLEKQGHHVIEAPNGAVAVEMAKEHLPAAIIMDFVMPEMDGFAAAKRLMLDPITHSIPVIMVSSKAQLHDRHRADLVGAKGYIIKPADEATLTEMLRSLL
jgi:CheY-like chemotaxis protein